jgi:hypothetical protein
VFHTNHAIIRRVDIVARLSVYTVPSSDPSHLSLVPHFLTPKISLHRTLVVIVLDWTKPWSFLDQLKTWLSWVEEWSTQDPSREVQILREEGRERCKLHIVCFASIILIILWTPEVQSHLQYYVEPAGLGQAESVTTVTSSISAALLPLGSGTLTHNTAGVPIIVACTKADLIDEEEDVGLGIPKGKGGEWEERTDGVMQVLRTICLKCQCNIRPCVCEIPEQSLVVFARWCGPFLYDSTTHHPLNFSSIRPPFPLHAASAVTRFSTTKVPIPLLASTEYLGS